ncbi:MAG: bifunctional demethylmenaquinone methyltransferase/2-methoxy-6-polyprenyl-1,4-benzoquinol methylase UbiE [Gammaproteobacteria bacterium]|nr:bifunctional demethylmenaquinone methyltransferase/2-methoxy-6-polyprenyl-1,4-benzoquinol methylase UbiE [Gammaproteobacteria bacterium]
MNEKEQQNSTTHFGYQPVSVSEKARKVAAVFDSVAPKYDVMNDLMSLGVHRLWKRFALALVAPKRGERILDLATGTGDLVSKMAPKVGSKGEVIASDINASMLHEGRRRLVNEGVVANVRYVLASAEILPFPDHHFNCITISFGLRNVTDKLKAIKEMYRVLKPGGRLLVLEFSQPVVPGLKPIYDAYSFKLLPLIGQVVARDADSYRYLAESIRMHPNQEILKSMIQDAGFGQVDIYNMSGGIVAIHRAFKL